MEQRTAIVLVDVQGLPVDQAAEVLGVPTGTVKSRCSRGRARLALSAGPPAEPADDARRPTPGRTPGPGTAQQRRTVVTPPSPPSSGPSSGPSSEPWSQPPHLDLDALADALAGEGDAAGAAHLAACRSCASRLDELAAAEATVVAVLGGLPAPALPDGLADRLSAALAAEAPLLPAAAGAGSVGASVGASVTALPAARPRPRRRWLPAAAAAVLLASGAGLGLALVGDGLGDSSSDETASSAGGLAERDNATSDLLLTSSGADWADPAAGTAALPQVLSGAADPVELKGPAPVAGSGAGADSADDAAPEALSVPDGLEALRTPEGLQACLSAVLPPDEPGLLPLAVDYASYDGEPALAVVLPDPDPSQVAVYVVGAGCSAEDDQTLFFLRAPRP